MAYLPSADPPGPYWAEESDTREHCYSIIPLKDGKPKDIHSEVWREIFLTLGKLGYLFRDAGHDIKHAVVSLNKAIRPKHLKQLEGILQITSDSGTDLSFV